MVFEAVSAAAASGAAPETVLDPKPRIADVMLSLIPARGVSAELHGSIGQRDAIRAGVAERGIDIPPRWAGGHSAI
jgi:hypothetical protein